MNLRTSLATLALAGGLTAATACVPPRVDALVQLDPCTEGAAAPDRMRCTMWVDAVDAWGYSAGTKFLGPYWQFEYDRDHNGGQEVGS